MKKVTAIILIQLVIFSGSNAIAQFVLPGMLNYKV